MLSGSVPFDIQASVGFSLMTGSHRLALCIRKTLEGCTSPTECAQVAATFFEGDRVFHTLKRFCEQVLAISRQIVRKPANITSIYDQKMRIIDLCYS